MGIWAYGHMTPLSDKYSLRFQYDNYDHPQSIISSCSFNSGYSLAVRAERTYNLTIVNNVAVGNWGGSIFIDERSVHWTIAGNLAVGTRQLPAVLLSQYPWLRPVAAFTFLNSNGRVFGNLAAGSEGEGFYAATSIFHLPVAQRSMCSVTRALPYNYDSAVISANAHSNGFYDNEAVACLGGLAIVATSRGESTADDCAAVSGFKGWRSGYTGVSSVDAEANLLLSDLVLAENHIGISLHSFKRSETVFNGLLRSKIIGSLNSDIEHDQCSDLADSAYIRGQHCRAFTGGDPLGVREVCASTIANKYRRVGLLLPQWTNRAQVN
jgi:hypothetical protein